MLGTIVAGGADDLDGRDQMPSPSGVIKLNLKSVEFFKRCDVDLRPGVNIRARHKPLGSLSRRWCTIMAGHRPRSSSHEAMSSSGGRK